MNDDDATNVLQSIDNPQKEDVKFDVQKMFNIDFSHLENLMQGFQAKIDTQYKKVKKIEQNNIAFQQAQNQSINKVVKNLQDKIETGLEQNNKTLEEKIKETIEETKKQVEDTKLQISKVLDDTNDRIEKQKEMSNQQKEGMKKMRENMKTQLKTIKKEIYGDDYVDSDGGELEEPQSPDLVSSPTLRKGRTMRAPQEDDMKEMFDKFFSATIQGAQFKDLIKSLTQGQMEQIQLQFSHESPAATKVRNSQESMEPPAVIKSSTPIHNSDQVQIQAQLKQIQVSLVHSERVELDFKKQLQRLESQMKKLQSGESAGIPSATQMEAIASTSEGQGGIDPKVVINIVNEAKLELQDEIADLKSSTQSIQSQLQNDFNTFRDKIQSQLKVMGSIQAEEKEELEAQLDRLKKQTASKLDSVYFDDELDQLKEMINILSQMTSDTNQSKELLEKVQQQKAKPKKNEGGMRMSEDKKQELELLLQEWPNILAKQKSISKSLEGLNISTLKEQLNQIELTKADKSELHQFKDEFQKVGSKFDTLQSQLKKINHQMVINQEVIDDTKIKNDNRFNEASYKLDQNQKKIDFFDTVINSMKKRMTDLQKQGKDNQAQIALKNSGRQPNLDGDEGQYMQALIDQLDQDFKDLKKLTETQKVHIEMQLSQLSNKVDQTLLKELEEKFERNIKTLKRDILIQNKKIESQKSSPERDQPAKSSIKERKQSVDFAKDALMPKLPFMRQGERISKFGNGYSKLLSFQHPLSPGNVRVSPMSPQHMAPSPSSHTIQGGQDSPQNRMDQTYPRGGSKIKLRYDSSKTKNQMKMRKEFIAMQQDYQTLQMASALGHKSTSKLMTKSPSSRSFAQSKQSVNIDNNYYIQPEQQYIGDDGQIYVTQQIPNYESHGFLPDINRQQAQIMELQYHTAFIPEATYYQPQYYDAGGMIHGIQGERKHLTKKKLKKSPSGTEGEQAFSNAPPKPFLTQDGSAEELTNEIHSHHLDVSRINMPNVRDMHQSKAASKQESNDIIKGESSNDTKPQVTKRTSRLSEVHSKNAESRTSNKSNQDLKGVIENKNSLKIVNKIQPKDKQLVNKSINAQTPMVDGVAQRATSGLDVMTLNNAHVQGSPPYSQHEKP